MLLKNTLSTIIHTKFYECNYIFWNMFSQNLSNGIIFPFITVIQKFFRIIDDTHD